MGEFALHVKGEPKLSLGIVARHVERDQFQVPGPGWVPGDLGGA